MNRPRLSADEPARVQAEARQILARLPVDKDAAKHRRELNAAMCTWKGPR